jgi:hypothetical protein
MGISKTRYLLHDVHLVASIGPNEHDNHTGIVFGAFTHMLEMLGHKDELRLKRHRYLIEEIVVQIDGLSGHILYKHLDAADPKDIGTSLTK